jgi:hypothetical protein
MGVEEQDDDLGGLSMDENYPHKPRSAVALLLSGEK